MDDWENIEWGIDSKGNWTSGREYPETGLMVWSATVEKRGAVFHWHTGIRGKGDEHGREGSLTAAQNAAIASIQKMMEA